MMSRAFVNMDGSVDAGYRYKMPAVIVKTEGKSKMIKTVVENLSVVCRSIGRPIDHLLTFLGQRLSAATKIEKDGRCYVTGIHDQAAVQKHILDFIIETVACGRCGNMETTCHVEGQKKSKAVFLLCKASSCRTDLDSSDRFVKYIVQHPPETSAYGQASPDAVGAAAGMARATALAKATEDTKNKDEKEKERRQVCRVCGHKTSKAACKKCGAELDSASSGSSEPYGVTDAQSAAPCEIDPLKETVHQFLQEVCAAFDLGAPRLQPPMVEERAGPAVTLHLSAFEGRLQALGGSAAAELLVRRLAAAAPLQAVPAAVTREVVLSGALLALRAHCDWLVDKELAAACRRLPARGRVIDQFIDFLEEEDDDSDEDVAAHGLSRDASSSGE